MQVGWYWGGHGKASCAIQQERRCYQGVRDAKTFTLCTFECLCTYEYVCQEWNLQKLCVCVMYVYAHKRKHREEWDNETYLCVCAWECVPACEYACLCVCVCVCTYIYIYIYIYYVSSYLCITLIHIHCMLSADLLMTGTTSPSPVSLTVLATRWISQRRLQSSLQRYDHFTWDSCHAMPLYSIYIYIHIYTYMYKYVCMYIISNAPVLVQRVCMCVCVCVWVIYVILWYGIYEWRIVIPNMCKNLICVDRYVRNLVVCMSYTHTYTYILWHASWCCSRRNQ